MGFGIGLGAFLEGAANGYSFGENIKDKKRQRENEDRQIKWATEDRAQNKADSAEDRDFLRKSRDWAIQDRGYQTSLQSLDLAGKQRAERAGAQQEADAKAERDMFKGAFSGQSLTSAAGGNQSSEKAATKYADYYMTEKVPEIVQFYMQRGEVEKASAFQTWATSNEVKRLTTSYGKALHAAHIGNDAGFVDGIADAYDNIDDGVTIVREKSNLVRDKGGNVTGANVTFKDTAGNTWSQTYDQAGIIEQALSHLAPHNAFEWQLSQYQGAQAANSAQLDREHEMNMEVIKAQLKQAGADPVTAEAITKEAARIRTAESQSMNFSGEPMTEEQLIQQAIKNLQAAQQGVADVRKPAAPSPYLRQ